MFHETTNFALKPGMTQDRRARPRVSVRSCSKFQGRRSPFYEQHEVLFAYYMCTRQVDGGPLDLHVFAEFHVWWNGSISKNGDISEVFHFQEEKYTIFWRSHGFGGGWASPLMNEFGGEPRNTSETKLRRILMFTSCLHGRGQQRAGANRIIIAAASALALSHTQQERLLGRQPSMTS